MHVKNIRESALKRHAKSSSKHDLPIQGIKQVIIVINVALHSKSSRAKLSASSSSSEIEEFTIPLSAETTENRWALKVVVSHYSLRSCLDTKILFRAMFPGSEISSKFQISKTKCAHTMA